MARTTSKGIETNEFAVIQAVSRRPGQTQREISRSIGLSLGMTNLLLLRLARKGYIKMRQLDWKRTEYLLTLKGAAEKARKSFAYTLHTMRLFRQIVESVQKLVRAEHAAGARSAVVVAWPETQNAISGAISELGLPDFHVEYVETFRILNGRPGLVFIATEETPPKPAPEQRFVQLLDTDDLRFKFRE